MSITPVLTSITERTVVQRFLYPAFLSLPLSLSFTDQFAFRPYGSPAAAIIFLLNTVTNLLLSNTHVIIISLDFSKAFDTVRHTTLLDKLAKLNHPDQVYNWLADFFTGHSHCTVNCGQKSTQKTITASINQGSAIGPAAYMVTASDFMAVTRGNQLYKFADYTYLIIPAINVDSRTAEVESIKGLACSRHEQHGAAGHLPVELSSPSYCTQSVLGLVSSRCLTVSVWMRSYAEARNAATVRRTYRHSKSSATAWTNNCLIIYS
jgi:Reverse transcriptase (RNA-dependent DNA polymerase)